MVVILRSGHKVYSSLPSQLYSHEIPFLLTILHKKRLERFESTAYPTTMPPSLKTVLPSSIGNDITPTSSLPALGVAVGTVSNLELVNKHTHDALPCVSRLIRITLQLLVLWRVGLVVYRLFFHPLAKYPGPKLYAASNLPFQWKSNVSGTLTLESKKLYDKYGPIVRVAPDHLSVDGSIAWPQIFQHRPGKTEWPKQRGFYHPGDEASLSQCRYSPSTVSQSLRIIRDV